MTAAGLLLCFTPAFPAENDSIRNGVQEIITAVEIASAALEAEVVKAEKKFQGGTVYWKAEMLCTSGSEVRLLINIGGKRIAEASSEEGAFDYEFDPGGNLIPLSEAQSLAEKNAGRKILKWKLVENKAGSQYHFWLFTKGGAAQFRVDALTGEQISGKGGRKKKVP